MTSSQNRSNAWKTRVWARQLRVWILAGKEFCRHCGRFNANLTFDHIIPYSKGGSNLLDNLTLLCTDCQQLKGNDEWPYQYSLADEGYYALLGMTSPAPELPRLSSSRIQMRKPKIRAVECTPRCSCEKHLV